jgi:hypothetical protein
MAKLITATQGCQYLHLISGTPGEEEKCRLVAIGLASPLFERVIRAIMTPGIDYGISDLPMAPAVDGPCMSQTLDEEEGWGWWGVLEQLASRTLSGDAALGAVQAAIDQLDHSSWTLFKFIITSDLRGGVTVEMIDKLRPGFFTFTDPPHPEAKVRS